jgi:hypothetical protein
MKNLMSLSEEYRGRKIIDTKHSIERFTDRYPNINKPTVIWVIRNAIDEILDVHRDRSHLYAVHSVSTKIGIIVNWRRDNVDDDGKNHAIIVTILPLKDHHYSSRDDIPVIVEQLKEWAEEKIKVEENRNILAENATYDYAKEDDFYVVYWEGKYYDTNAVVLFVE